jgi:hypothetical protein
LTITNGNACCAYPDDIGGGVYNDHATLTLNNCVISGNIADTSGGGVGNDGSNGSASAVINDTILVNNIAFTGSGGGILNDGGPARPCWKLMQAHSARPWF